MIRTKLYADPTGRFVHDVVLESCRRNGEKTALIDASCERKITFAEYGGMVEALARGLIAGGLVPGEVVAIFLPNSWEFAIAYHAA
ncbi:MAG: AMP-binding protein, partial [Terriglobales bacterium]